MDIGEKILELMENKKIKNVRELSKRCDIPYTTLRAIIDGTIGDIKINTAIKLCNTFNITLDELFSENIELPEIKTAAYKGIDTDGLDISDVKEINEFIKFVKSKKDNK